MKAQIEKLKNAKNESDTGGIFHNVRFHKVLDETKLIIKNYQTNIDKPEHLHYNSIMNWYKDNANVL